ncbi:MAG: hypothetical protein L6R39_000177 [Caloplaca ligustica]|nr:MAG: hypothetical protein L6R39_000177 [Caloplaca ligustica]
MLQQRRQLPRVFSQICRGQQYRYKTNYAEDNDTTDTGHHASAGEFKPTHHGHHPEPVNESLGRGFYVVLAALPLSFAIYKFSRSSDGSNAESAQPWFTRVLRAYDSWSNSWEERNSLHTKAIEQAAHDRNLFFNSRGSPMIDLSFPEKFNTGSPYNVPAGHGADLSELIAHYQRKNAEQDAKTRSRLESKDKELRQRESAKLPGPNPKGAPPFSAVTPTK